MDDAKCIERRTKNNEEAYSVVVSGSIAPAAWLSRANGRDKDPTARIRQSDDYGARYGEEAREASHPTPQAAFEEHDFRNDFRNDGQAVICP
jgi:hypothetical protein